MVFKSFVFVFSKYNFVSEVGWFDEFYCNGDFFFLSWDYFFLVGYEVYFVFEEVGFDKGEVFEFC